MAGIRLLCIIVAIAGWSPTLAEGVLSAETASVTGLVRLPRSHHRNKLCIKYGICESQGYGGHQQGYGGYGGHQGYQGGYGYQGPPINIAISQSQSSANEGGGGYGSGYYPNNYQYNHGGHPGYQHGYNGYNGYHGYNGFPNRGHGGYRPGFDNGNFAHNNQFNGNFYSGGSHGGHGHDDGDDYDGYDGYDYDEGVRSASGGAVARSSAVASTKS